jgi:hypothetical protein
MTAWEEFDEYTSIILSGSNVDEFKASTERFNAPKGHEARRPISGKRRKSHGAIRNTTFGTEY